MEKKRVNSTRMKEFLKKNIYYFIMALCLIAVAAMITITVLAKNKADDVIDTPIVIDDTPAVVDDTPAVVDDTPIDEPVDQPVIVPIVFKSPVDSANIIQNYAIESLVWNSTLKHYAVHTGIDFGGKDGDNVYSVYGGTVSSIDYDVLNGYTVTISHSDTLKTVYASLNEPTLTQGQTVLAGAIIGTMGNTATNEYASGAHLHFCAYENGKVIDPYTYLAIGNK